MKVFKQKHILSKKSISKQLVFTHQEQKCLLHRHFQDLQSCQARPEIDKQTCIIINMVSSINVSM